jgi:hypothetical protein
MSKILKDKPSIMKRKNLPVITVVFSLLISVSASAKVWRVNRNAGASADFVELSDAHNSAAVQAGGTLYVEGSSTYYNATTLTKKLVIIGPSYFLTENTGLQANTSSALVFLYISQTASQSQVIGVEGYIYLSADADDLLITRSKVLIQNWGSYTAPQKISNVTISKCYTDGVQLSNFATENLQIINCICRGTFTVTNNATTLLFRNNNLTYSNLNLDNAYIANCIFFNSGLNCTNTVLKHNLAVDGLWAATPDANNNKGFVSGVYGAASTSDGSFRLSAGSPAKNYGEPVNGETPDCGAYGTADPYRLSGIPPIPTIYSLQTPSSIPSNATSMTITISTRSNN